MRQLVVLVGLPGSGKSHYVQDKPLWAVVSRDVIRHHVFACSYNPQLENAVERAFSTLVIEAVGSPVETVCIDDLNLLRKHRHPYVELGKMTQRKTVAVVMPLTPVEELYQRVTRQLDALRESNLRVEVAPFPQERFDAMARCYERVLPEEGFEEILVQENLLAMPTEPDGKATARRRKSKTENARSPLPLFAW